MGKTGRFPGTYAKSAYEFAKETGEPIAGIKVGPGPSVEILFVTQKTDDAEAALAAWQRGQGDG